MPTSTVFPSSNHFVRDSEALTNNENLPGCTTFPPSTGGLMAYGLHIAEELRRNPFLSLTVLADKMSPAQPELEGFSVERCWSFDDPTSAARILSAISED